MLEPQWSDIVALYARIRPLGLPKRLGVPRTLRELLTLDRDAIIDLYDLVAKWEPRIATLAQRHSGDYTATVTDYVSAFRPLTDSETA